MSSTPDCIFGVFIKDVEKIQPKVYIFLYNMQLKIVLFFYTIIVIACPHDETHCLVAQWRATRYSLF